MKMRLTILALVMAITPQVRATIYRAFRADDFEIVWTDTLSKALQASITRHPSLVVLDVDRSAPGGRTILDNLRNLNPTVPMVVLAEQPPARGQAIVEVGVAVLRKPVSAGSLAETANTLFSSANLNINSQSAENTEASTATANSDPFREMLRAKSNTPFAFTPPYQHWGLNE